MSHQQSPPAAHGQSPSGVMASGVQTPKQTSSPGDWKEMHDPKSGKKYWVNHLTKQMSYNPPSRQSSPPSADAGAKGALGKSSSLFFLQRNVCCSRELCLC